MASLLDLGRQHGTDKANPNRRLLSVYESFVAPVRGKPVALLEIGVLDGGSLRTWQDYFPYGLIYGIDINPEAAKHRSARIKIFVGKQADTAFLDSVVDATGPLDIIIDDGSHLARDQVGSLMHLWPHLKSGGTYVVEDTHTSYMPAYKMGWRQPGTTVEFLKGIADDVQAAWHDAPVLFADCESVAFYQETCVIKKR